MVLPLGISTGGAGLGPPVWGMLVWPATGLRDQYPLATAGPPFQALVYSFSKNMVQEQA